MNETDNKSAESIQKSPDFDFSKRMKRFKLLELSPTMIGCFLFTLSLIFCLFLLDYRTTQSGKHAFLATTWFFRYANTSSSSSSSLSSQVTILEGVSNGEKVNFVEEGGDSCDIFDGNWIWDESYPLYESKDCMFMDEGFRCSENGRPDNFYTKWRWQPKDCNLPRFDAKDMLERLRNKRLVFVGDSIGRNQWESLLCMLSSAISNKTSIYEVNGSPITKHTGYLVFKFRDFNCTIEYYRAPYLVQQGRPPRGASGKVRMTLKLDKMDWSANKWKDADVLILNSGHWWNFEKTIRAGCYFQEGMKVKMEMNVDTAFRRSIETLFDWINHEVNMTKTRVFFRSYAPVHFRGGDWKTGGACHLETLPDLGSSPASSDKLNVVSGLLSNYSKKSQLHNMDLLNITPMTSSRKDGHLSLYYLGPKGPAPLYRQDCSHWCLPGVPDAWNELLYAVFLKREIVQLRKSASPPLNSPQQQVHNFSAAPESYRT